MNKFVVLSTQRTGSTMLITLLDSHPDVFCPGEIFSPGSGSDHAIRKRVSSSFQNKILHQVHRAALVRDFLDDHYTREGYGAIGFKFMYSDARHFPRSYPSVLEYLRANDVRILHNVRENKLRVVLSRVASKSSGVYRSDKPVDREPVILPARGLLKELRKLESLDDEWSRKLRNQPYRRVVYESLLSDPAAEREAMLTFVGVDQTKQLSTPYVKLTAGDLQDSVKNYKEVEFELKGTEFEWCLYRETP